jgi:hypothetical protein
MGAFDDGVGSEVGRMLGGLELTGTAVGPIVGFDDVVGANVGS